MDALTLHKSIVTGYKDYISSFINIADEDIKNKVDEKLDNGELWPDPLVQFNPTFLKTSSVIKLVDDGAIHPEIDNVFNGFELYAHQTEAITHGAADKSFIVTSGTGSGKSLTYIGTIFNQLFSQGAGKGVKAILVYPMNALINSQEEELAKFAENYKKHAGKEFPITFGAYTGQTSQDLREKMVNSPPDILLTNYMMLELMLTRQSEIGNRNSIFSQLEYLVFDELHTYRGRQGADVGMLVRRIKAQCANKLTCIGTSATMVSSGSLEDQKTVIAKVAYDIFGEKFSTDQKLSDIFDTVVQTIVNDRLSGTLTFNSIETTAAIFRSGELDSEAYKALRCIAYDFTALIARFHDLGHHPGFLLHDRPRESDLESSLYLQLFHFIHTLEQSAPNSFQYIVTTTEAPPEELQNDKHVRLELSSSSKEHRFYRENL